MARPLRCWARHSVALATLFLVPLATSVLGAVPRPPTELTLQGFEELDEAPDVGWKTPANDPMHLQDFGGRVVLLTFWATWCPHCRAQMPGLERLYQAFERQGFVVVAVSMQERPAAVLAYLQGEPLSFPILLDATGEAKRHYAIPGLPTTYILDRHLRILAKAIGSRQWDSPAGRAYIRTLLEKR